MARKPSPCKGCELRHPTCHARCEEYKAYSVQLEKERVVRIEQKQAEDAFYETRHDRVRAIAIYHHPAQKRRKA